MIALVGIPEAIDQFSFDAHFLFPSPLLAVSPVEISHLRPAEQDVATEESRMSTIREKRREFKENSFCQND